MSNVWTTFTCGLALLSLSACTTYTTRVENAPTGQQSRYISVDTPTAGGKIGIESQDIVAMTDKMVRDMLATPVLVQDPPATVIVDDEFFRNESTQRINKKLIVDRLRIELLRAAQGRMYFVARHRSDMLETENKLKEGGKVGGETMQQQTAQYRLAGNFQNLPDATSHVKTNYVQVVFEMIDLKTGQQVWGNLYEFKKGAVESTMYE